MPSARSALQIRAGAGGLEPPNAGTKVLCLANLATPQQSRKLWNFDCALGENQGRMRWRSSLRFVPNFESFFQKLLHNSKRRVRDRLPGLPAWPLLDIASEWPFRFYREIRW